MSSHLTRSVGRTDLPIVVAIYLDSVHTPLLGLAETRDETAPCHRPLRDAAVLAPAAPGQEPDQPWRAVACPVRFTRREAEVLQRLARGDSNRAIAEVLVVSVRTVERHIDNLYAKTGLHGRQQLRSYARAHDLSLSR